MLPVHLHVFSLGFTINLKYQKHWNILTQVKTLQHVHVPVEKENNMQRQGLFPVFNLNVVMARTILEIHKKTCIETNIRLKITAI